VLGPADFLQPALRRGELVRLLEGFEAPSRAMHLLYTAHRHKTAKVRQFIDAAVRRFA
jgi:DNA-binding transcriptional LysR family regulator